MVATGLQSEKVLKCSELFFTGDHFKVEYVLQKHTTATAGLLVTKVCAVTLTICVCANLCVAVEQAASKQARLEREELDMVSTSLPVSTMGMSQADDQIRASVAAAECHTTAAAAQLECTSGAQPDVQDPCSKGVTDPSGDSSKVTASVDKQVVQNSGLLTSFLGAYGSDSDESDGGPT